jgi:carbonic anhydrase
MSLRGVIARRGFLRLAGRVGLVATGAAALGTWTPLAGAEILRAPPGDGTPADPDAALNRLIRGNRRYVRGTLQHPIDADERRRATIGTQTPFAAVLACADARVPPETIFDQGLGDLFVVRVAGNVLGPDEIASLAYAAEHLGVDLIFVLGHESCGAVKTTIDVVEGRLDPGEYAILTDAITPAVRTAQASGASGKKLLAASVEDNVRLVTAQVPERSPAITAEIARREIAVMGGVYHLTSGKVTILR